MPNSSTIPKIGATSRVKDFLQHDDIWICLGRTTPWDNDDDPPQVSGETTAIEEPIIYKKITEKYYVKEVPGNGDYYIEGRWFSIITEEEARASKADTLVLAVTISDQDVSDNVTFRQIGIYSRLVPASGHENDTILTPEHVSDPGWLEWYSNREPIQIQPNQSIDILVALVL